MATAAPKKKAAPAAPKKSAASSAPAGDVILIPLNKLVESPLNVRKTEAGNLEELAASIHAEGLLQNLVVTPQLNSKGRSTGFHEVVAGGRRRKALLLLVERSLSAANRAVPCKVLSAEQAISASIAENEHVPLHPADQFEAFQRMLDEGQSPQQIADRFGISTLVVERRLKLAKVAPKLLDLYRKAGITLEELMALALSDDHKTQLQVWGEVQNNHAEHRVARIKNLLTSKEIDSADDPRALFVGIEMYQAMGGSVRRDLFSDDTHFYLSDAGLLERLAQGRLEGIANELQEAEGLAWTAVMTELDNYTLRNEFSKASTEPAELTKKQATRLKQVERELERLGKQHNALLDDDKDDEADALLPQIDVLEDEQRELEEQTERATARQKEAGVGAVVTIGPRGRASIYRHLVKVEDKKAKASKAIAAAHTAATTPLTGETEQKEEPARISEALVKRLTAHRTAALQVTLASQARIAITVLAHKLVLEHFYDEHFGGMVSLRGERPNLRQWADDIGDAKAAKAMFELKDFLASKLPNLDEADDVASALFEWMLLQAADDLVQQLLAYCIAQYVDTLAGSPAQRPQALRLMPVLGLDLADWWEPTRETYFNYVPKPLIDAAVIEGAGQAAAIELKGLKKAAAAELAEVKLAGLRWLPEVLRGGE